MNIKCREEFIKRLFLLMEISIYIIFLLIDFFQDNYFIKTSWFWRKLPFAGTEQLWSQWLKFIGISLCFFYVIYKYYKDNKSDRNNKNNKDNGNYRSNKNYKGNKKHRDNKNNKNYKSNKKHRDNENYKSNKNNKDNKNKKLEREEVKYDTKLLLLAMFFTVSADVCLLLKEEYTLGVIFFILVQTFYMIRIETGFWTAKSFVLRLLLRSLTALFIYFMLYCILPNMDGVVAVTAIYFVSFLDNIFLLICMKKKKEKCIYQYSKFLFGMILFFICDLNVGIYNLSSYIIVSNETIKNLIAYAAVAMWMFYLPGQIFIVLSQNKKSRT